MLILLVFFLLPFQDDATDVSEEVKQAWVSDRPVRHVPLQLNFALVWTVLVEERASSGDIRRLAFL